MQEWKKNTIILGQTNKKTPEIMCTRSKYRVFMRSDHSQRTDVRYFLDS